MSTGGYAVIQTLTVSTPGPQGPSNGTVTVGNGTTHVGEYNANSYSGDAAPAVGLLWRRRSESRCCRAT